MIQPHQHLDPLRKLISERGINSEFRLFFNSIKEDHQITQSEPQEFIVIYYTVTPQGETIETTADYNFHLKLKLRKALEEVKNNIIQFNIYNLNNEDEKEKYVELQARYLQNIVDTEKEVLRSFTFIAEYLYEVINELNMILPEGSKGKLLDTTYLNLFTPVSEEEKINDIFSFFQGKNEQGERIMSDRDYTQMTEYINILVDREEKPTIEHRLNPKLDNGIITFAFWVLHRELYTTKKIRKYFLEFLKEAFTNFDDVKPESLRSSFGRKTKLVQNHLPPVLRKYWNT